MAHLSLSPVSASVGTVLPWYYVGINVDVGVVAGFMTSFFGFDVFLVVLILLFGLYDDPTPYLLVCFGLPFLVVMMHVIECHPCNVIYLTYLL